MKSCNLKKRNTITLMRSRLPRTHLLLPHITVNNTNGWRRSGIVVGEHTMSIGRLKAQLTKQCIVFNAIRFVTRNARTFVFVIPQQDSAVLPYTLVRADLPITETAKREIQYTSIWTFNSTTLTTILQQDTSSTCSYAVHTSVSYTHLDVYKRQALYRVI